MKQFIVLRVYTTMRPDYVASFDNIEDATNYAALSKLNEPNREFVVAKIRTQVANLI